MIELARVQFSYAGKPVLHDFSLKVAVGERVVLAGPSGSGKTTILRLIAGLIAPERGSITIGGQVASCDGEIIVPPERRNLGYVFQDLALWPHMTAFENVEYPLKAAGILKPERIDRAQSILALMEIPALGRRYPEQLSGGEQQRVALARALVSRPSMLLMDEPFSALDERLSETLCCSVLALQEKFKFALIYVTHRPDEVRMLGGRSVTVPF